MTDPERPDGLNALDAERATVDQIEAQMSARLKRSLSLWAIRWVIGLGLAFAIVVFTGQYHWLPWAAAAVALISLAVILGMHVALTRKYASTRGAMDRAETALREDDDAPR